MLIFRKNCVQIALSQNDNKSLEDKYYKITSETMIRIMEVIDGYYNQNLGKLKVTCKKREKVLKITHLSNCMI